MKHRREHRPLLSAARRAGWRVVDTKHGCLVYPDDPGLPAIAVGGTSSDWRAARNARARLRRAGLKTL
ncbi:hypothetical protein GCM10027586_08390 [Kineococcus gypseus]